MRKGQTSTEYLVILVIVIVVGLFVLNLIGGFPDLGSSSSKKVSDLKLANDVIGIESYFIGNTSSIFKLKNNYYDSVTVLEFKANQQDNLTCNSSNTIPALPINLNVGESKLINCSIINSSSYEITVRQTPQIAILYLDSMNAQRTAGNVPSYGNVSSVQVVVDNCSHMANDSDCWSTEQGSMSWSDEYIDTTATSLINGSYNTAILASLAGTYPAADICANLTESGHSDWYLPAQNELVEAHDASIPGFSFNYYWSSTESGTFMAYFYHILASDYNNDLKYGGSPGNVRCLR